MAGRDSRQHREAAAYDDHVGRCANVARVGRELEEADRDPLLSLLAKSISKSGQSIRLGFGSISFFGRFKPVYNTETPASDYTWSSKTQYINDECQANYRMTIVTTSFNSTFPNYENKGIT